MVGNLLTDLAHPEFRHDTDELCVLASLIVDGIS